jgi:alpha-L-rhamnosidase
MSTKFISGLILLLLSSIPRLLWAQELLWIDQGEGPDCKDVHMAFRGSFTVASETALELQLSGASWYRVWIDGQPAGEGPDRYAPEFPLYQVRKLVLPAGDHLIAVHLHSEGVDTRMLRGLDPFLYCRMLMEGREMVVDWKCRELEGYARQLRRVSAQFGWLEWVDTSMQPRGWVQKDYDDASWTRPVKVSRDLGRFQPSMIAAVRNRETPFAVMDEGPLASYYGYELDNPSARFFLRDLTCTSLPPQGIWKRYDLGKVRLVYPQFILDLPEGTVVEFAFSESLRHGRVMPWINLSASDSYNMVHFKARGGVQEFQPLTPRAGRFVEMHIVAPPGEVRVLGEKFLERGYHDQPDGAFSCSDPLLDRIWQLGVDTYMSCAEDALVDNPTRERGQWMGDVGIVGLQIGASAFSDLGIIKSGLKQFAQCAREDGMVAGLAPGNLGYLSTFAAMWTNANLYYWKATGDMSTLVGLFPAAERNIAAFEQYKTPLGISPDAGWAFVDWGYVPNEGEADMGLNLIYYDALRAMVEWSRALELDQKEVYYMELASRMEAIIASWYAPFLKETVIDSKKIGYHRTVLGMRNGFIPHRHWDGALAYLKEHMLDCFPNNHDAPRLSDPGANNPRLITPYFAHYAFPLLIEHGEMEFVLEQYKTCWGWMLDQGSTTCLEVFDTRWSHCHQWAGCPTWQLSRYVLGLHPAFDRAARSFDLKLIPGNLQEASGKVPLPDGRTITVSWKKAGDHVAYTLETPVPIEISMPDPAKPDSTKKLVVRRARTIEIPLWKPYMIE